MSLLVGVALVAAALAGARLFRGMMSLDEELFSLSVVSVLVAASALLAEALAVPSAVLEIVLGVAAGLSGVPVSGVLDTLGVVGSVFIMYMAGLEVEPRLLYRHARTSLIAGLASFAVPALATYAVMRLLGYSGAEAVLASIGVATTSVAVVYSIIRRGGFIRRPAGQVILATAMVADVASIVAFAITVAGLDVAVVLYLAGAVVAAFGLARLLEELSLSGYEAEVRLILGFLVAAAIIGEYVGVHAMLFAFFLGVATRGMIAAGGRGSYTKLSAVTFGLLAPIFFIDAGLHATPSDPARMAFLGLVLLAASLPLKVASTHAALRLLLGARVPLRVSMVFGARLTVSTVIAYAGESSGVLGHELAGAIVLSALVATVVSAVASGTVSVDVEDV